MPAPDRATPPTSPGSGLRSPIHAISCNFGNSLFATGHADAFITLWDSRTGTVIDRLGQLYGHRGPVYGLAFQRDKESILPGPPPSVVALPPPSGAFTFGRRAPASEANDNRAFCKSTVVFSLFRLPWSFASACQAPLAFFSPCQPPWRGGSASVLGVEGPDGEDVGVRRPGVYADPLRPQERRPPDPRPQPPPPRAPVQGMEGQPNRHGTTNPARKALHRLPCGSGHPPHWSMR